ncbi:MAG TPA: 5-carboxymethyl-2-hydroxymuconate Delta-isomerase [Actinobacteria bacterium]|nr:5-carboxymethyl-2-hydroxymuconate Delta-isomerase [Actinomycetota bacterium]
MPHLVLEYSANLESEVDIAKLVSALHEAAMTSGVFKPGAVRTRAVSREIYMIADGHPDNRFAHLVVRIGSGRSPEVKRDLGRHLFEALTETLAEVSQTRPLAISMEVQEIDPHFSFRKNNLHEIVAARGGDTDG